MDGFMNGRMHRWMDAWMDERTDAVNVVEIGCMCVRYELYIKFITCHQVMQTLLFFSHVAIVAFSLSSLLLSLPCFVIATGLRYLYQRWIASCGPTTCASLKTLADVHIKLE